MDIWKSLSFVLLIPFLILLLAGCQHKEPEPASEIEVVFTANTWGEISPCKT
jgi:predicted component of type VI protein secretion system